MTSFTSLQVCLCLVACLIPVSLGHYPQAYAFNSFYQWPRYSNRLDRPYFQQSSLPTLTLMEEKAYSMDSNIAEVPLVLVPSNRLKVVQGSATYLSPTYYGHEEVPAVRLVLPQPIYVSQPTQMIEFPAGFTVLHNGYRMPMSVGVVLAPVLSVGVPQSVRVVYALPTQTFHYDNQDKPARFPTSAPGPISTTYRPSYPSSTAHPSSTYRPSYPSSTYRPSYPSSTYRPSYPSSTFSPALPSSTFSPSYPSSSFSPARPSSTFNPSYPSSTYSPARPSSTYVPPSNTYQRPNNAYLPPSNTYLPASNAQQPPSRLPGSAPAGLGPAQQDRPMVTILDFPSAVQTPSVLFFQPPLDPESELGERNPPQAVIPAGIVQSTAPLPNLSLFINSKESEVLQTLRDEAKKHRLAMTAAKNSYGDYEVIDN